MPLGGGRRVEFIAASNYFVIFEGLGLGSWVGIQTFIAVSHNFRTFNSSVAS